MWLADPYILLFFLTLSSSVQGLGSITEVFDPPLSPGDVITIAGVGSGKSAGNIRLHSERGSCDTAPRLRVNTGDRPMSCNPLILKLLSRRHQIQFYKKGIEKANADVLMMRKRYPSLRTRVPYIIKITVTPIGFNVVFNDERPAEFIHRGEPGQVVMIRAYSGNYSYINLERKSDMPLNEPGCGRRKTSIYRNQWARITNGQDADPGAYPWQVALRRKEVYSWAPYPHVCGGSLISACWVVTAAHCVNTTVRKRKGHYVIRVGDHYNGDESLHLDDEDVQDFAIEEVYVHCDYSSKPVPKNDIALLKLKQKDGECATYSKFVNSVCLPEPDIDFPVMTECHISGWGAKNWTDRPRDYPHYLQHGKIQLQDFEECQRMYGRDPVYNKTQITEGMLCASSNHGVDTCQGDSGGPLVCELPGASPIEENPFVLWGITSWGYGCADSTKPGVYAQVSKYTRWIMDKRSGMTRC